ncbi:MAG: hypothetical protein HC888_03365 [Candidatus Competibacteraceae bacterium]|nr:hypothetical protein [Candidatus Competibacteraceae bacterium]
MAKQNGNGGGMDLLAAVNALSNRATEIRSRLKEIDGERASLLKEESQLARKLGVAVPSGDERPEGKRRGRKPGSTNKPKSDGAGRGGRTVSKDGRSIQAILIQDVLPTAKNEDGTDSEGMNREAAYAALQEFGVASNAENPLIVIGQAFTTLRAKKLIKRVSRGHWVLSASGEKHRERTDTAAKTTEEKAQVAEETGTSESVKGDAAPDNAAE